MEILFLHTTMALLIFYTLLASVIASYAFYHTRDEYYQLNQTILIEDENIIDHLIGDEDDIDVISLF